MPDSGFCPVVTIQTNQKVINQRITNQIKNSFRQGNLLVGEPTARLFPAFKKNSRLETGLFSRKVKDMEKSWPKDLVKYRAHAGRFSITTLSMFSKDNNGNRYT